MKKLLFSVTKKDFIVQTFCSGGPGGQHQNRTESGVRIIHKESGATGESREHKSQHQNKKEAINRLIKTNEWKIWHNKKVQEILTGETIEGKVNKAMDSKNIKIETKENGKWVEYEEN